MLQFHCVVSQILDNIGGYASFLQFWKMIIDVTFNFNGTLLPLVELILFHNKFTLNAVIIQNFRNENLTQSKTIRYF